MSKSHYTIVSILITFLLFGVHSVNGKDKHWRRDRSNHGDHGNDKPDWPKEPDHRSEGPLELHGSDKADEPSSGDFACGKECKSETIDANAYYIAHMPPHAKHKFMFDIDANGEDVLIVHFSSDPKPLSVLIEAKKESNGNTKIIPAPAGKVSWDLIIPTEFLRDFKHGKLFITANTEAQPSRVGIRLGYGSLPSDHPPVILFALPSFLALAVLFCCLSGCYCYVRRRLQDIEESAARGMHPSRTLHVQLSEEIKEKLSGKNLDDNFPEATFEDFKSPFSQPTCTICLEELKEGSPCRQLNCDHIFHSQCVKSWLISQVLKGRATCPNCNEDVLKAKGRDSVDEKC